MQDLVFAAFKISPMKTKIIYFFFALLMIFNSCQERAWDNPFDPECPKDLFTPSDFTATLVGNSVKLSWNQTNKHISGFRILKKTGAGAEIELPMQGKSVSQFTDPEITLGELHNYTLVALAGENQSNPVQAQITPVLLSSITTIDISGLRATTAISGGNITNDGGAPVTARGMCWNTSTNPTVNNFKTSDGTGTGSFTSNITGLTPNTIYYARAYATNIAGTSYGNEITFKTYFGEVTDADGNVYLTVKIGEQVWMAENLKTTKYNDGSSIPNVTDNSQWANLTTGAYCWYNNDAASYKADYGALYNYYAVSTNKLAPVGWHVPTHADWTILKNYLGNLNVGAKLKETGTNHWPSPNTDATNEFGFTAIPGGYRPNDFGGILGECYWWSSSEFNSNIGYVWVLVDLHNEFGSQGDLKYFGHSVRCLFGILSVPSLTTSAPSAITTSSAILGGNITNDGNAAIIERGVVYATTLNPTTANSKVAMGSGTGSFNQSVTGLTDNTTYYVRAYAINSVGTAYGTEVSFTTSQILSLPTVTTSAATTITTNSAVLGGNVTSDGNATVTEKGIVYATTPNPTTANTKVAMGSGTGSFNQSVAGLTANTTYYVRAYAINSVGTAYGTQVSFTTSQILSLPTVTTSDATTITTNSAVLGGIVTNDGNATVTEKGIVYATAQNPTITNTKVVLGSGTGSFSNTVSGLVPNTTYYVRAYAINNQGTAYGNNFIFKTLGKLPSVITEDVSGITTTSAVLNGLVNPNSLNTTVSFEWGETNNFGNSTLAVQNPVIGSSYVNVNSVITGLSPSTLYYVRISASNSLGATYGQEISFITRNGIIELITTNIKVLSSTSAFCGVNILNDGGDSIIDRGVCFNLINNPTINDDKIIINSSQSNFNITINNLLEDTRYYLRAFASNKTGVYYGDQVSFTTLKKGQIADMDGNVYNTIAIGTQIWTKENLKTTKYANGDSIPNVINNSNWQTSSGAWRYYNDDVQYNNIYGKLYNWQSIADDRNICPHGWHIPSENEWETLELYLGMNPDELNGFAFRGVSANVGEKMKKVDETLWNNPNTGATNESGFSAVPGGRYNGDGTFIFIGLEGTFWSSTLSTPSTNLAWLRILNYQNNGIYRSPPQGHMMGGGFSCRCIKD